MASTSHFFLLFICLSVLLINPRFRYSYSPLFFFFVFAHTIYSSYIIDTKVMQSMECKFLFSITKKGMQQFVYSSICLPWFIKPLFIIFVKLIFYTRDLIIENSIQIVVTNLQYSWLDLSHKKKIWLHIYHVFHLLCILSFLYSIKKLSIPIFYRDRRRSIGWLRPKFH